MHQLLVSVRQGRPALSVARPISLALSLPQPLVQIWIGPSQLVYRLSQDQGCFYYLGHVMQKLLDCS